MGYDVRYYTQCKKGPKTNRKENKVSAFGEKNGLVPSKAFPLNRERKKKKENSTLSHICWGGEWEEGGVLRVRTRGEIS
jgi:hypothetical protein